ncbi:MAG TPA: heavy metal-binding domain-containing protein, partial [Blastocatellia bacterium]|nr:heavy metal-binding domain-containing protein [Blastocatellia bacterium]
MAEIDPVCGMSVLPRSAAGSREHEGKTYYFCGTSCLERFRNDPKKYLDHPSPVQSVPVQLKRAPVPAVPGNLYTCPMHPEIRERKSSSCPQCGMALEPLTFSPTKIEYTCPMHPEIARDGPGFCPICGMALEPRTVTGEERNEELISMTRRFKIGIVLTVPLLVLAMSDLIPGQPVQHSISGRLLVYIQLVLATPVVLWGGWPFFQRGWASIVNRSLNMFTLIAIGTGVAYGYSVVAAFFP